MLGLYALKPWYADRLSGVRGALVARRVPPNAITAAGVAFAAGAGLALAGLRPGLTAAAVVATLLAARLACSNLDGAVARARGGPHSAYGSVINEVGDRAAEIAMLAGLLVLAPAGVVAVAAFAASAPSWVSLAGRAAGAPRLQGGPVGKTERCVIVVATAATGWAVPLLVALGLGSMATAAFRLLRLRRILASS
jgi:CDP-diacylglycerol--glycerol-3-phosphate 3-phosphatidyltransferase